MDLLLDALPLGDVCTYVRRTFEPVAADKGLSLDVVLDADVPAAIVTDEQRLQQILRNLLSNAFKFTAQGGVTLRIQRAGEDAITFSVIDTGIGIAQDKLAVIFEAFQQADGTTSRTYGGTGLGLSISRELARALGGEISVQSTVHTGSIFTLTLRLDSATRGTGLSGADSPLMTAPPCWRRFRSRHLGPTASRSRSRPAIPPGTGPWRGPSSAPGGCCVLDRGGLALHAIRGLVGRDHGVELTSTEDVDETLAAIDAAAPDCLVIGSRLSKTSVFGLLDELRGRVDIKRCRSSCGSIAG